MTERITPEPKKRNLPLGAQQKAYHQALAVLRERHRKEFDRIYEQILDEAEEDQNNSQENP
jgi:hypothetical protein